MAEPNFQFEISLSVLNHLGRNLYRNFITVLGEAISNAWDADAKNVWIDIDKANSIFSIKDDGHGMTADDFQSKFLKIGYSKRKEGITKSSRERPYIGAKGIGKLALLSCAKRVSVFTKTATSPYVGGVIDNSGLDAAIREDLVPDQYPLEALNFELIAELANGHECGTIIVFEGTKDIIRNSEAHIKKLLAMSFKFSLLDEEFNIFVNGREVDINDLKDLMDRTEFVWLINSYTDDYVKGLSNLKAPSVSMTERLDVKGFIATASKPRDLKITGTDERATIDLFVNGRIREKNILRHIPTQRIIESYIYGQIHFNIMDQLGGDPFTSSREGIVEDDKNFNDLLRYLQKTALPKIMDDWDDFRLRRGEDGDDENTRRSKKSRRARSLYALSSEEFTPEDKASGRSKVNKWLNDLTDDAEFNISAYVDCFLSENLVRRYIHDQNFGITKRATAEAEDWKKQEEKHKQAAGISFGIRRDDNDSSYVGMDALVEWAEGAASGKGRASLIQHALNYKPVRNAVGHTGLLTKVAKDHLNVTFENIKARVLKLISDI